MKYSIINECRICRSTDLEQVFYLGSIAPAGYFPRPDEYQEVGPVTVLRCESCGLSQLRETYNLYEMYGRGYGYRSGLNKVMVKHLSDIVKKVRGYCKPKGRLYCLDIGSNDGTLLGIRPWGKKVGVDPTVVKFKSFYDKNIKTIPGFFSKELLTRHNCLFKYDMITSIAMFYDLPDPVQFAREVKEILAPQGVWCLEVGYLPHLFANNGFDSICQEHLEYYRVTDIQRIADIVGLKIIDLYETNTNGGSVVICLALEGHAWPCYDITPYIVLEEDSACKKQWNRLSRNIVEIGNKIKKFLKENPDTVGYGASTKGNVLLQYFGIRLPAIVEINPDKFGKVTPGTRIPIIEEKLQSYQLIPPSHWFVLPWHFREDILAREKIPCFFPLPAPEVVIPQCVS